MALLRTARGLFRLVRPLNAVLFFAGVALGALLAGGAEAFSGATLSRVLLAMVSAALIGMGANAINDVYDLAIDRVNRPARPLPAGLATPRAARVLWAALTSLGLLLGWVVSPLHGLVAVASSALLWAYSARLKRSPGWGNLAVAAILGAAIVYGGLAVGAPGAAWLGAAFAVLTTLAREIAKDLEDVEGDATVGAQTLPLRWGASKAAALAFAVVAVTVAVLPAPAFMGIGSSFLGLALPAAACLLGAGWALLTGDIEEEAWRGAGARASVWLKGAMVLGVVALALARLG